MLITALTKFTALDFPGKLACIVFTGGCNFRCGFCYNDEFVLPERLAGLKTPIPFEVVLNFLKSRRGFLDGVVICGGEPTVQVDLEDRIREIKELGYSVKLDTNGSNPLVLKRLIDKRLVDFIAMDLKDDLPYRRELVGVAISPDLIRRSIGLIKESGLDYEFRTTVVPGFHDEEVVRRMGGVLGRVRKWSLQRFVGKKTLDPQFGVLGEVTVDMKGLMGIAGEFSEEGEIR